MVDISFNINKQYVVAAMKASYAHQEDCSHQVKGNDYSPLFSTRLNWNALSSLKPSDG